MIETTFEPLQALSLARTALDDPAAIGLRDGAEKARVYAIYRIDEAIGALRFEPANDARSEAQWVLTHLGRLLAAAHDAIEAQAGAGMPDDRVYDAAAAALEEAGNFIDEAIGYLGGSDGSA